MSYRYPNTGDPELDRKLAAEDYDMLFPRLQAADTEQGFAVWLDKLALIDRNRIVAHLREQWDSLDHMRRLCAKLRLKELRDLPLD